MKFQKKIKSLGQKVKLYLKYLIVLLVILLVWSLAQNIQRIVGSKDKITQAERMVNELKSENSKLKKLVELTKSTQFVEREARNKLGLAYEGEIVVILPEPETLKLLAPVRPDEVEFLPKPNWKKWMELFF